MMPSTAAALATVVAVLPVAEAYTTLATGAYMQSGSISSTFRWQSSGTLSAGGCSSSYGIKNCYSLAVGGYGTNLQETTAATNNSRLRTFAAPSTKAGWEQLAAADDENLAAYFTAFPAPYASEYYETASFDSRLVKRQVVKNCTSTGPPPNPNDPPPPPPSPRQRIEFMSWPGASAGQLWRYTWKTRHATTSTGNNFNHLWQILRRDACGGPVITLDLKAGQAMIIDQVRKCPNNVCASIPVAKWFGKTIVHTMVIRYGIRGSINYSAVEAGKPTVSLLKYYALGDMGASTSLKTGIYRASVDPKMTESKAWIGDWTATRTA